MKTRHIAAAIALAVPMGAHAASEILVHRDPGCGCCAEWAKQVKAQFGRAVRVVNDAQRAAFKKKLAVPADLSSCHTAIVDGMVFEGHVPIQDMKRLLAQRPKGVIGLVVAGMPMGSPGMEAPGMRKQAFDVIAFGPSGRRVYMRHGS